MRTFQTLRKDATKQTGACLLPVGLLDGLFVGVLLEAENAVVVLALALYE